MYFNTGGNKIKSLTLNKQNSYIFIAIAILLLVAIIVIPNKSASAASCVAENNLGILTRENVSLEASGSYKVWTRLKVNSAHGARIGVEVTPQGGNPECLTVTGTNTSGFSWHSTTATNMTQSGNTVKLVGLDSGVQIDRIMILQSNSTCVPDNERTSNSEPGDNCDNDTPIVTNPTPTDPTTPAPPEPNTPPNPDPVPVDTTPPTQPGNFRQNLIFDFRSFKYTYRLNWTHSTDDVLMDRYTVSRDGTVIGETKNNSYSDSSNLQSGKKYVYSVTAVDAAGNSSTPATVDARGNCFLIWCWKE